MTKSIAEKLGKGRNVGAEENGFKSDEEFELI